MTHRSDQWQEMPTNRFQRTNRGTILLILSGVLLFALAMTVVSCAAGSNTGGSGAAPTQETAEKTDVPVKDDEAAAPAEKEEAADESADEAEEPAPDQEQKAQDEARQAIAQKLETDIEAALSSASMQVGVCAVDLESGAIASVQGDVEMVSASMIKMIIAATTLEQVKAGAFSLDDYCTLEPADIVGGTGELAGRGSGAQVTYRELLEKMISVSDNTGTNALIRTMGMDAVNEEASKLGLSKTHLNRLMMDEAAIAAGIENYTSAQDLAQLFKMTYEGTLVNAESSEVLLGALEQQQDWGGIRNGLPEGVPFAHKTGALGNARHDGGIVEGDHPFVLVVLCGGEGFYEQGALDTMARVAEVVYQDLVAEG